MFNRSSYVMYPKLMLKYHDNLTNVAFFLCSVVLLLLSKKVMHLVGHESYTGLQTVCFEM